MKTWRWVLASTSAAHVQGRRRLRAATEVTVAVPVAAAGMTREVAAATTASSAGDADTCESFRYALVELMLGVVEAWERSTGLRRLEFAEKSRIWRVTIDDGRLRARAMERYLTLAKLPRHPRWREVVRSAYYVLNECALEQCVRTDLQRRIDAVLAHGWGRALMKN
jgi:two-component system sensor histidine kinase ChiS